MKKRSLLMAASLVLALLVATTGTLAFLQDTATDVNVMTLGSVTIEQHEYERVVNADGSYKTDTIDDVTSYVLQGFTQNKPLVPIVGDPNEPGDSPLYAGWDDTTVRMTQVDSYGGMDVFAGKNAQDKFVTVENTGASPAYVRSIIAIEIGNETEDLVGMSYHSTWTRNVIGEVEANGTKYNVFEFIYEGAPGVRHENGILPGHDTTYPSLSQVYIKSVATNEDLVAIDGNKNGWLDIIVISQAIQADGFENAKTALDTGFGVPDVDNVKEWLGAAQEEHGPVIVSTNEELTKAVADGATDIIVKAGEYTFPGNAIKAGTTITCDDGVVFTGTSSLNINGATVIGATFSNPNGSVANNATVNGIYKNCTFTGSNGLRSCYAGETVVFENCVFSGDLYGMHFDSGANDVIFKNCTFSGFNTMGSAITQLTMEGCTFKANGKSDYNGINLWGDTDMTNCTFIFDGTAGTEWVDVVHNNQTVNFTNCFVSDGTTSRALTKTDVGDYGTGNTITINP